MSKHLVCGALLLLLVACGGAAAPTTAPTATPPPTLTPTAEPTATPLPTTTPTPEPTATPTVVVAPGQPPAEGEEYDTSILVSVFPEIGEKMKDIRPVYTAYYHGEDWHAPGRDTTVDEVFKLLKMENIVAHEGYQQISPAMVVDLEPDLIIADSIEAVVKNPDLSGLHMIEDTAHIPHHIFVLREGYSFSVSDPGFRDTVAAFAAFAYPDTFPSPEESGHDQTEGHEEGGHDHGDGHSHGRRTPEPTVTPTITVEHEPPLGVNAPDCPDGPSIDEISAEYLADPAAAERKYIGHVMCFEEKTTDVIHVPSSNSPSTHVLWVEFEVPSAIGDITVTLKYYEDPTQFPDYPAEYVDWEKENYRRLVEWVERHEIGDKIPVTCTLTRFLLLGDPLSSKPLVVPQLGCVLAR